MLHRRKRGFTEGNFSLVAPADGLSLEDKVSVTELLLRSGATIQELNDVRKHLSAVKGGRLLEQLLPARVLTLVVSDVIGNDLSSIGSGPTTADPSTFEGGGHLGPLPRL